MRRIYGVPAQNRLWGDPAVAAGVAHADWSFPHHDVLSLDKRINGERGFGSPARWLAVANRASASNQGRKTPYTGPRRVAGTRVRVVELRQRAQASARCGPTYELASSIVMAVVAMLCADFDPPG